MKFDEIFDFTNILIAYAITHKLSCKFEECYCQGAKF